MVSDWLTLPGSLTRRVSVSLASTALNVVIHGYMFPISALQPRQPAAHDNTVMAPQPA